MALIGAAVLLVFAMGSFIFLHGYFFVSDDQGTTLYCDGLWQCFVTVSREGLLDSLYRTCKHMLQNTLSAT